MEKQMSSYDNVKNFLKSEEGYVGRDQVTERNRVKGSNGPYSAYNDSMGYLTTGYGNKVSEAKEGTDKYNKDVADFKKFHGVDPFNMTESQAEKIKKNHYEKETEPALRRYFGKDGDGVDKWDKIPAELQAPYASAMFNLGEGNLTNKSPNFLAATRAALSSGSRSDWMKVANEFENYHGNNKKGQPLDRRAREAKRVRGYALQLGDDTGKDVEGKLLLPALDDTSLPFTDPMPLRIDNGGYKDV